MDEMVRYLIIGFCVAIVGGTAVELLKRAICDIITHYFSCKSIYNDLSRKEFERMLDGFDTD